MKLLQMLKLTKLRKLLKRQAKDVVKSHDLIVKDVKNMSGKEIFEELSRKDQIKDVLSYIMDEHKMVHGRQEVSPASRFISLGQLATFPPTQVRNIQKTFIREPTALRYYSNKVLDSLLVEWEEEGSRHPLLCKKAIPTVLITKRSGYRRKIDGKYNQTTAVGGAIPTGF